MRQGQEQRDWATAIKYADGQSQSNTIFDHVSPTKATFNKRVADQNAVNVCTLGK